MCGIESAELILLVIDVSFFRYSSSRSSDMGAWTLMLKKIADGQIADSRKGGFDASSSRASSRDGMRRPTSSGSRKIALQNVLEGTRKEIGHGEVYQGDQHSDERNRIGFGGRVERLGGSGRVGHGGASRTGEDDRERVAESVRSD